MNKLIKLSDTHYIIVDDSEIKEGDWYFDITTSQPQKKYSDLKSKDKLDRLKITHSTKPLEGNREYAVYQHNHHEPHFNKIKPLKLEEIHELLGIVNIEVKALKQLSKTNELFIQSSRPDLQSNLDYENGYLDGAVFGYNKALQDNSEKKYTEEDIEHAIFTLWRYFVNDPRQINLWVKEDYKEFYLNYIKTYLQPKTEWEVKILDNSKIELI